MGKGGGGGSTPRLLDDNLKNKQFLNVIDLVSEGPIEGPVGGMSGFLLNGTPVVDEDGNPNIHGVEVQWRAGTQTQEPLEDFPFVEKEIPVNVEVKKSTPILRTISDQETDRVRFTLGVSALVSQDDKGNQYDATAEMLIEVNDGSGWVHAEKVTIGPGKISGQYLESHIIDAPKKKPFQIRVSRLTDDSKSDLLKNGTVWASYTEITDAKFSYPNSAVVGMKIDKSQYGDTPNRTYHIKGMIIQVPDNYDPESRTYTGIWTGRFKPAWSNNPAWVFYDLVTNERYGIGEMIGSFGVDKFALYAIARYCDELVDDGFGNKEPRFTFNAYITSQRKAKEVLDDLASVFRGMPLWDGQQLTCFQDRPSDPVWTYTNSNVIDGKFKYTSTAKSARHNAIEVSWINPSNGWSEEREFIQDDDLIQRFGGVNVKKVTAFGCTSRGQAHRVGKWILQTEKLEKDSVTFSTGREGINCISGDIIEVADDSFSGVKVGGRVLSVNGSTITVDAPIDWKYDDKGTFSFLGASGGFEKVDIQSIDGDIVTLREIPNGLKQYGVFSISKSTLTTRLFRVISIAEDNEGNYLYNCIQHEPQKESIVDNGVDFTGNPPTQNVIRIPNIERLSIAYVNDSSQVQARAMWMTTTINRNISFNVTLYKDSKVVSTGNTTDLEYYFNGLEAGDYLVGVRGRDTNGMLGNESKVQMVIGTPSAPSSIIVESGFFEIKLIPHIAVPHTLNTEFEFWFSGERRIDNVNEIESKADFLGRAKFWTKGQLKAGRDYWFYVRSVNEYGKSHFVEAVGQASGTPKDMLDELGNNFLTTEAGQIMQEQIDFSKEAIAELELDTIDVKQKVVSIDRDVEAVNEAVMMNTKFTTEVHFSLKEEVADRKAEIFRIEQVQVTDREAAARWQEQITAKVDYNASEILNIKDAQSNYEKATAQQISQVKADVDGVKSRVTTVETATSDLEKAQAKFEQSTTAEFGEMRGYITHFETSLSNVELAVSEAIMQTTAQVNQHSSELLQSKADVKRIANATATNEKATAELAESVKAHYEDSQAEFVDVRKSIAEQDKAHSERTEQVRAELGKDINANKEEIDKTNKELSDISAAVTTNTKAIAETDKTLTELEQVSSSRFDSNEATIANLQNTQANAESSQAETTLQLAAQQNEQGSELLRAKASIRETNKIIVDNDKAYAQKFTQIDAQLGENGARFTRVEEALADTQQSVAKSIERLDAQFDETQAAIEQMAKVEVDHQGNASSIISYKAAVMYNGQSYDAAMLVGAGVKDGQVVTQIGFSADTFGIFNPVSGKLEPVFFVENGQVFINEAFLDKANVREMVLSEAIKSKNYELGKAGFIIDANTGNAEFNNATFRGTIDGADGNFKGTVYVEKLLGDVNSVLYFDGVENSMITGGNNYIDASVSVIYAGGMPYDVFIALPSLSIVSKSSRFITESRLHITIAEENKTIEYYDPSNQTTKEFTNNGSFGFVIKAGERNKKITITATTRGVGKITAKLKGFLITAGKLASTSFSKES
ncbi:phage tail protein [Proteus mirabilis]|uniref:TipJ family phage tail tip protein n=3 Tax=Proteus mirabilis TaxID=584 RepID=UPI002FC69F91